MCTSRKERLRKELHSETDDIKKLAIILHFNLCHSHMNHTEACSWNNTYPEKVDWTRGRRAHYLEQAKLIAGSCIEMGVNTQTVIEIYLLLAT